jgi:putative membrane protein
MARAGSEVVHGLLAGAIGAACMTPLRLGARRLGLVEKATPQAIEESLAARMGLGHHATSSAHHAADQLLHLAFGAVMGGAYALLSGRRREGNVGRGMMFGTATWALGAGVVVPLLRAARPPWRARISENAVNVTAHLLYGLTTDLVLEELSHQSDHRPTSDTHRWRRRVG